MSDLPERIPRLARQLRGVNRRNTLRSKAQQVLLIAPLLAACGPDREVWAQEYDPEGDCLHRERRVGTTDAAACEPLVTIAEAPDGTCWLLPDSCAPRGWQIEEPDCPRHISSVLPTCTE